MSFFYDPTFLIIAFAVTLIIGGVGGAYYNIRKFKKKGEKTP